ncbi:hypothetical protein MMC24_007874 [Lignoscripta atroalba]|nr:hypothetical protein [Lignoscripta atroalba]
MHIQNILIQATLMATAPTPIIVPPGNTGCLVAPVPNSQRIYYQAEDTTIREIIAGGFPGTNPVVTEQVLIPAGVARPNTPMTCASWGDTDYLGIDIFYIGTGYSGKHLRQKSWRPSAWSDGPLNPRGYTTGTGQEMLAAFQNGTGPANGTVSVLFACGDAKLCEMQRTNEGGWTNRRVELQSAASIDNEACS